MSSDGSKAPPSDRWRLFERVVAAIHQAQTQGARVAWNDRIDERQFDVTLRFQHGLYGYLTVIECKDSNSAVPVTDVEAFVTKSQSVRANKAVMVASAGFQSGAKKVALTHGIELLTINETEMMPPDALQARLVPAMQLYGVTLNPVVGLPRALREDRGFLEYLLNRIMLSSSQGVCPVGVLIDRAIKDQVGPHSASEGAVRLRLKEITTATNEDDGDRFTLASVDFNYRIVAKHLLNGPRIEPRIWRKGYEVKNVLTGAASSVSAGALGVGFGTNVVPGQFYDDPMRENYYYCVSRSADSARMIIIESLQHGILWQVDLEMYLVDAAAILVPLTSEMELARLIQRLTTFQAAEKSPM